MDRNVDSCVLKHSTFPSYGVVVGVVVAVDVAVVVLVDVAVVDSVVVTVVKSQPTKLPAWKSTRMSLRITVSASQLPALLMSPSASQMKLPRGPIVN